MQKLGIHTLDYVIKDDPIMAQLDIGQVKIIELDILKALHAYCQEHNIRYYLASGTLIGAIRHNGFIPWDDDIDVYMPRPDYDALLADFNSQNPRYQVQAFELDRAYPYPFAKISDMNTTLKEHFLIRFVFGVNIDVFPLDGIDEKDRYMLKRQHIIRRMHLLKTLRLEKRRGFIRNAVLLSIHVALSPFPIRFLVNRLVRNAKRYPYDRFQTVAVLSEGVSNNYIYDKSVFSGDETHAFEDGMFYIPKGYREYLTRAYGDFMQPPPPEKRICPHHFDAYLKDGSSWE